MISLEKIVLTTLILAVFVSGCSVINDITGSEDRYVKEEGGTLAEWKERVTNAQGADSEVSITIAECEGTMNQKMEECRQKPGWRLINQMEVDDLKTGEYYSLLEIEWGGCPDRDKNGKEYGYAKTPDVATFDSQTEGIKLSYQVVCSILCTSWRCEDDAEKIDETEEEETKEANPVLTTGGSGGGYDGTYSGTGQTVSPLGTAKSTGTFTVTNGYFTDPAGFFTGNVDSSGHFTGKWHYSQGSLPIPMSGSFSASSSFTLSGSIGRTVSGTFTLHKP